MPRLKKFTRNDQFVIDVQFGANGSISVGANSVQMPISDYLEVVEVRESHSVAATDGGGSTLTIEKLTGTQAPAGGANMFKTSTINLKTAANTQSRIAASQLTGLSIAQKAAQQVSPGDRIGFTINAATTLAGVGITLVLRPTRPAAVQAR